MAQVIVSNKIRVEGGKDYLEWGTHSFYIKDLYFQMDIVDDFFKAMHFSKYRLFCAQTMEEYLVISSGRKVLLGFRKR